MGEYGVFASEVCRQLELNANTLRKWCIDLEEHGYSFERDKRNQRIYYSKDIVLLGRMKELSAEGSRNKSETLEILFSEMENGQITQSVTDMENVPVPVNERSEDFPSDTSLVLAKINNFEERIIAQQQQILIQNTELTHLFLEERKEKNELKEQLSDLQEKMNEMLEFVHQQSEEKSKSLFQKLFSKKSKI
ncbi:hypothetical protein [Bacillus rhizoplanae]|uniref:hypothetical protein n=1 Tax=Bacillus rhizoplanae TaxID=2880966 RepID=UPI003D238957